MKPTDFARHLTDFLSSYLPHERGVSKNTLAAYRDTFVLFINYMQDEGTKPERLTLEKITQEVVLSFLDWLQAVRHCGNSTRNNRLAALHSFFSFLQYKHPENLADYQKILSIRVKNAEKVSFSYLSIDGVRCLLKQPDGTTRLGRRDRALLSLLYDTGARVQELIDLTPSSLRLDGPCTIRIHGKGNKTRIVPMLEDQVTLLKEYMKENRPRSTRDDSAPLFFNSRREKLTRAGVGYILEKYAAMARQEQLSLIPAKISPHSLRHSKAMHLLQAGVNLVYIRDILGHVSVQTTEVYARADSKQKREAIEKAYTKVTSGEASQWLISDSLLTWLKSF